MLNELRRAFGGTIDDANADAIAFAAAELYRKDVEPRLWEHKTAQEILDGFGVPRAGAFTRYSLSDRLLLLRRSADPSRTEQAHALLTELGVPESDPEGSRLSLKDRLQRLLEGTAPLPPLAHGSGADGQPENPSTPRLAEVLQTIAGPAPSGADDGASAAEPPPSPELPAAELVGLRTVVAGIQEELIRLRQAVETVQGRLDEALALLRAGAGAAPAVVGEDGSPAFAGDGSAGAALPVVEPAPETAEPAPALAGPEGPEGPAEDLAAAPEAQEAQEAPELGPPDVALGAEVAPPEEVTRVVPVVAAGIPLDEAPPAASRRRRRRGLPKLIVIAIVLGLLIAGAAIAISVVGWTELRSNFDIGSVDGSVVPTRELVAGAW